MPIPNALIQIREITLHTVLNIDKKEVLNPRQAAGLAKSGVEVARQLKEAVNHIKVEAIDETGHHVDYFSLKNGPSYRQFTQEIVPQLHTVDLHELGAGQHASAFWINLYNALIIHAVIAYDVKETVTQGGPAGIVRFFRRAAYNVGGFRFSLEDIEHGILRANRGNPLQFSPQFARTDPRIGCLIHPFDPRVHFALNCASQSCPPIGVYSPENLDGQLDLAAANFIQHETELLNGHLSISQIFKWYQKDFGGKTGLVSFLIRYLPDGDSRRAWLAHNQSNPRFQYSPYDWSLNI